jgi:hypothetical protein
MSDKAANAAVAPKAKPPSRPTMFARQPARMLIRS